MIRLENQPIHGNRRRTQGYLVCKLLLLLLEIADLLVILASNYSIYLDNSYFNVIGMVFLPISGSLGNFGEGEKHKSGLPSFKTFFEYDSSLINILAEQGHTT
jgi:hypothetical protein